MASVTEYITGHIPATQKGDMRAYAYGKQREIFPVLSLTKIELAVDLLMVDNIKAILDASLHVADLKVEPLVMMIGVDVWIQDQVILIWTDLTSTGRRSNANHEGSDIGHDQEDLLELPCGDSHTQTENWTSNGRTHHCEESLYKDNKAMLPNWLPKPVSHHRGSIPFFIIVGVCGVCSRISRSCSGHNGVQIIDNSVQSLIRIDESVDIFKDFLPGKEIKDNPLGWLYIWRSKQGIKYRWVPNLFSRKASLRGGARLPCISGYAILLNLPTLLVSAASLQ